MDNLIALIAPGRRTLFLAFADPRMRPPVLEEMWDDIHHVITSIASRYTDPSCPQLHFDDLVSEGRRKLAELIHKGYLDRLPKNDNPTRTEFFKVFKTAVNNHIKGLVHKHRGTLKRTGHRIPTKEERADPNFVHESTKPIEISLDDPDAHLQLSEQETEGAVMSTVGRELLDDIEARLTPLEKLVLQQLLEPGEPDKGAAYLYALMDALRGSTKKGDLRVRIKYEHMARGLGISLEVFLQAQKSIQQKYMSAEREQETQDIRFNASLTTLSQIFNVQVPETIVQERDTVARLFTMVARRESEKVNDDVRDLLIQVGAKPPELRTATLDNCFGVMFEKGNKTCATCGVQQACQLECQQHGIDGSIRYSPKLLGAKTVRIPVLVPRRMIANAMPTVESKTPTVMTVPGPLVTALSDGGERDDEVANYLAENFSQVSCKGELFFKHKDPRPDGKVRYIFWVARNGKLRVRFCNPSDALKERLNREKNGYYLPDAGSPNELVSLINRHAKETF
jgi:hypothetical protein